MVIRWTDQRRALCSRPSEFSLVRFSIPHLWTRWLGDFMSEIAVVQDPICLSSRVLANLFCRGFRKLYIWQCLLFWLPVWLSYPQLHIRWPCNHRVLSQWWVEREPPAVPGSILWWTTPCGKCIAAESPPPLWWYRLLLLLGRLQPGR